MDVARSRCYLEYVPCRVRCPEHGVVTESVPWARHASRYERGFEVRCVKISNTLQGTKGSRYALVKNPEDLTGSQRAKLEEVKDAAGSRLFCAWELKEDMRAVFAADSGPKAAMLANWLQRASSCGIGSVEEVADKVRRRFCDIVAAVRFDIGNGRVEAVNNKVKVTVRMGYGFRNVDNLVALLILRCGGCKPALPGRPPKERKKAKRRGKRVMRKGLAVAS